VDIAALEEDFNSEWSSPTFAIAKKNETIRAQKTKIYFFNITHFQSQKLET
jgi:hypothetical protein